MEQRAVTPVVMITGAGSGLGAALAEGYARRGYRLALSDARKAAVDVVARTIEAAGGTAAATEVDVTDGETMRRWVDETVARWGRVDLFVNNAGIGILGLVEKFSAADGDKLVDVNVRGVLNGVHAVYPVLIRQGSGHIVNVASAAGLMPTSLLGIYGATKFFVVGLSKNLRPEAARHGVKVTAVCPGPVRTPLLTGGAFGKVVATESITETQILAWWDRIFPITVDTFAKQAMRGIDRNRPIVVTPRRLGFLWRLLQWFPWLEQPVLRADLARSLAMLPGIR